MIWDLVADIVKLMSIIVVFQQKNVDYMSHDCQNGFSQTRYIHIIYYKRLEMYIKYIF